MDGLGKWIRWIGWMDWMDLLGGYIDWEDGLDR